MFVEQVEQADTGCLVCGSCDWSTGSAILLMAKIPVSCTRSATLGGAHLKIRMLGR